MRKLLIEILKEDALQELKQMETEKKIQILQHKNELSKQERQKVVDSLKGSLSEASYYKMLQELKEMRS